MPKPNEGSPADVAPKPAPAVPESYSFKAPDGTKLDDRTVAEAGPIFRELGLSNDQAQRLVDFYTKQIQSIAGPEALEKIVNARNEQYMTALKSDPEIGGKLEQVKQDLGRAYDAIGRPELISQFKSAMESSPEGNNPAFVKLLHAFAQKVIEGKPASGSGPSPHGQSPGGNQPRPTIAAAMWPNLVSNSTRQ